MGELLDRAYGPVVARVTSSSDPSVSYPIRFKNGSYICPCDGFKWRGHCSHADPVKAQGLTKPLEEIH